MKELRVTKYNPKYRDKEGRYILDEWTSFGDIDKFFSGEVLSSNEYIRVEDLYVNAVVKIMECNKIDGLTVCDIEKYGLDKKKIKINNNIKKMYNKASNNLFIEKRNIADIIRLLLRELMWCRLVNADRMYVHFGYDYYMYIGSKKECNNTIEIIKDSGLFVEDYASPYIIE